MTAPPDLDRAPLVLRAPAELVATCDRARQEGHRVGLVPTMGALHEGHLALVDAARARGATTLVVTVFVNPRQFGPGEDLDRYPRPFEEDLRLCQARGVDILFAPTSEAMYPPDFQTTVDVTELSRVYEGAHRPGHFRGVTTVVAKLFALTGPSIAVFGRKDFQQWRIIERMAQDLRFPVEVVGQATVREPDGLALSSRNRYLSAPERQSALSIARGLSLAEQAWQAGERYSSNLEALVRQSVQPEMDRIDYIAAVDPRTLEPRGPNAQEAVVLVAAHIGTTRLIDNRWLGHDDSPAPRLQV